MAENRDSRRPQEKQKRKRREQKNVKRKRSWKHILEYELGVLVLILVLLIAWFGPDLYASWQDQAIGGQVVCSARDEIRFLDTDSLDIAGRMSLLRDAVHLEWQENDYPGSMYSTEEEVTDVLLERPRRLVVQWVENGVLPKELEEGIPKSVADAEAHYNSTAGIFSVVVDQNVLNVVEVCFRRISEEEETTSIVVLIADADKDVLYYAALCNPSCWDWMAGQMESFEGPGDASYAYWEKLYQAEGILPNRIVTSGDLAAVSGAAGYKAAEGGRTISEEGGLYQDFTLQYDRFTGTARISLVCFPGYGYGMEAALGTPRWRDFYNETINYLGESTNCYDGNVAEWLNDPYAMVEQQMQNESYDLNLEEPDSEAAVSVW